MNFALSISVLCSSFIDRLGRHNTDLQGSSNNKEYSMPNAIIMILYFSGTLLRGHKAISCFCRFII